MDLAFVLVLSGLLWVQSWYLLGFYSNAKTLGIVAAGVAIVLFGIVLFQDKLPTAVITPPGALPVARRRALSCLSQPLSRFLF